jgi:hypothetical protein
MKQVENILLGCTILGFAVLLMWFGMIALAGESVHSLHSDIGTMRGVSVDLFMAANYIGIGAWKMGVIFCFAIPWLAMKLIDKAA